MRRWGDILMPCCIKKMGGAKGGKDGIVKEGKQNR
jgi:hypothetical protein